MLSKHHPTQRDQLEMIALDQPVQGNHPVRKMETAIDFSFICDLVEELYSEAGRPSVDASDAHFRCHKSQENGRLGLAGARNGLNDDLGKAYLSLE